MLQPILDETAQPRNGPGDAGGPGAASLAVAAFGRRDERGYWSRGISTDFFQAAHEPADSSAQRHADMPVEAWQSSAAGWCGEERIFPRRLEEPHDAQPPAPPARQRWEMKSCSLKGEAAWAEPCGEAGGLIPQRVVYLFSSMPPGISHVPASLPCSRAGPGSCLARRQLGSKQQCQQAGRCVNKTCPQPGLRRGLAHTVGAGTCWGGLAPGAQAGSKKKSDKCIQAPGELLHPGFSMA